MCASAPDHISEGVDVALVGEVLTAAEVVALPERDRLSHHVAQRLGLVVDVADLAERGPAPEHEDRPSLQQPDEHPLLPVGHDVARAHHHRERDRRRREPRRRELLEQPVLTEQLVEPVLDLLRTAVDRRLLRDRQQRRPRVDHGGADEHVVTDPPPEQIDHELDVFGVVRAHVVHAVELLAPEHVGHAVAIGAVGGDAPDAVGERRVGAPAVEHGDVVTASRQLLHEREAVELRTADDEDLHRREAQDPESAASGRSV